MSVCLKRGVKMGVDARIRRETICVGALQDTPDVIVRPTLMTVVLVCMPHFPSGCF